MFTVGELARLTGITVRTLHHYDEIGLVVPSERTAAGYRMYASADVARLQQVLLFRELGIPLDEIAAAIDGADRAAQLREHRVALVAKRDRIDRMLAALDAHLGDTMQPDDVKKMFDGFDPAEYEVEAREKWGETDAYKEAARRTATYGNAEWAELKREVGSIYERLAARIGTPVGDPAVQALVEEHRRHLERWFYPCAVAMHKGLGQMYVADPRFTANLDKVAPGFARYLADAIAAS